MGDSKVRMMKEPWVADSEVEPISEALGGGETQGAGEVEPTSKRLRRSKELGAVEVERQLEKEIGRAHV